MPAPEVVLCNPLRTAIGSYGGSLKDIPAPALGAVVVREVLRRSAIDPAQVDAAVMGNVIQAGVKMNPARQAAIGGGLPVQAPFLRALVSVDDLRVACALHLLQGQLKVRVRKGWMVTGRAHRKMS